MIMMLDIKLKCPNLRTHESESIVSILVEDVEKTMPHQNGYHIIQTKYKQYPKA